MIRKITRETNWLILHPCDDDFCFQILPTTDFRDHVIKYNGDCWCEPVPLFENGVKILTHMSKKEIAKCK